MIEKRDALLESEDLEVRRSDLAPGDQDLGAHGRELEDSKPMQYGRGEKLPSFLKDWKLRRYCHF